MTSSNLPVNEVLAHLQKKIAFHREQQEEHAKQEALHAGKRALHEAEHRKAVERFEALQAASAAAGELLQDIEPLPRPAPPPRPALAPREIKSGGWHWLADLLERVIETKAEGEVFGANTLVDEILERWGSKLRQGIDPRSAQTTLRRWARDGRLDVVRKGRSKHEALYTKSREWE